MEFGDTEKLTIALIILAIAVFILAISIFFSIGELAGTLAGMTEKIIAAIPTIVK